MKRSFKYLSSVAGHLGRSMRGKSDYKRWSQPANLQSVWDGRTEALARLVAPGSTVLELGAGACRLKDFLPEGCTYTPSDLVERGPDTFICDLNKRPLPSLERFAPDTVVMSGVLEYVKAPDEVADWLAEHTPVVVMSYQCVGDGSGSLGRVPLWLRRSRHGWVNHYTSSAIRELFTSAGFACEHTDRWQNHSLFVFRRQAGSPAQ